MVFPRMPLPEKLAFLKSLTSRLKGVLYSQSILVSYGHSFVIWRPMLLGNLRFIYIGRLGRIMAVFLRRHGQILSPEPSLEVLGPRWIGFGDTAKCLHTLYKPRLERFVRTVSLDLTSASKQMRPTMALLMVQ